MIFLNRQIAVSALLILGIPYIMLLTFKDGITGNFMKKDSLDGNDVVLNVSADGQTVSKEAYLMRLAAVQIPAEYEKETIKAQMIITRTWLNKKIEEYQNLDRLYLISEKELGIPVTRYDVLKKLWGSHYNEYRRKFEEAEAETKDQVITFDGKKIDALFHRASAGMTRPADEFHPYLTSVESVEDKQMEGYMKFIYSTKENFIYILNKKTDSDEIENHITVEDLSSPIEVLLKDKAGYVISIRIGGHTFTGDEIEKKFGLSSTCFEIEETDGRMRMKTKGSGHGYGFSQFGANEMAKRGKTAEELLKYYYKNIDINVE